MTFHRLSRLVAIPLIGLFVFGLTTAAAADPPTREPVDFPTAPFVLTDTEGNHPCGFRVELAVLTNKEVATTFVRKDGTTSIHITGSLKVRLTNLAAPGTTVDLNISGPTHLTEHDDGSVTQIALGRALWTFDPGIAPDLPRLALISGRTVSMFDPAGAFSLLSVSGHVEDLCAVLAS